MRRVILVIIGLFITASFGYCQESKQPLELTIKSDKQVYEVGEKINITASIRNNGKENAKIYSPDYAGVSELVIKNSKGLVMKPRGMKIRRGNFESLMSIPSQGTGTHTFENLMWFHCGGAWQFTDHAQLLPDIYTVTIAVTNPPSCVGAKYLGTDLSGVLNSNTITLEVIEKKLSQEGEACSSNDDCSGINCAKHDTPVKEGYKPFCEANQCKCMCRGCK